MGKYKDLTGKRFGSLVVIKEHGRQKCGAVVWECQCDCGNTCTASTSKLTSGRKKSCRSCSRIKDYTGQKFGMLTPIKYVGTNKGTGALWLCQCDCGNQKVIDAHSFTRLKTRSCGCLHSPDLSGQRFEKLLVVGQAYKKDYKTYWLCKCDCGNETIVLGSNLRKGGTTSCGCRRLETVEKNRSRNRFVECDEYMIGYTAKGEPFYFDKEDFERVKQHYWYANANGYIVSKGRDDEPFILLHRLVTDCQKGKVVDHINHKREWNIKANLRICSQQENTFNSKLSKNNTSGITGVCFNKKNKSWMAQLCKNDLHLIKSFKDKNDAIEQRKKWEEQYFGEYAYNPNCAFG